MKFGGIIALICFCVTSCQSIDESSKASKEKEDLSLQLKARANPEAPDPSCQLQISCDDTVLTDAYHCIASAYSEIEFDRGNEIHSWGSSLCQAQKAMISEICKRNMSPSKISDMTCSPEFSGGECPAKPIDCGDEETPTKCFAKIYDGYELAWNLRPTSWARNECEARNKLKQTICHQGLNPKSISQIECEELGNHSACISDWPVCSLTHYEPTICRVSKIGEVNLERAWISIGINTCDSRREIFELLCRFSNLKNKLTPKELGDIECWSKSHMFTSDGLDTKHH